MAEDTAEGGVWDNDFGLPADVVAVLPTDPFEQLDVARKITSIALAARVRRLESEAARLRQNLAERDGLVADLRDQVTSLDASLGDLSDQLAQADQEKEDLINENAALSNTVQKLQRDVSKLEIFKKTLMQSLEEEEENSQIVARVAPKQIANANRFSIGSSLGEEDGALSPIKAPSAKIRILNTASSVSEEDGDSRETASRGFQLTSYSNTPGLTPPYSPPRVLATSSPTMSNPVSPRGHSSSFRSNMLDEKSSSYSSVPASNHSSMNSSFNSEPQTGRTRVDGKEFFRQVRSRLSYEQFSAFLATVKELNAHKQTKEETLRKADEIFGLENKDLYTIFEGLITRNIH